MVSDPDAALTAPGSGAVKQPVEAGAQELPVRSPSRRTPAGTREGTSRSPFFNSVRPGGPRASALVRSPEARYVSGMVRV